MTSHLLNPLAFPLHGSRLIEASAGTGKTWTIAALYVRLVLGHGDADTRFARPLLPADILVMTFTRAATRELSNRVRERLIEAAKYFRHESLGSDPFLDALLASYPDDSARQKAAHRLMLAAETMDEAAIFTIDAWCQRMLREHAFDSGSLFDEELVSDEQALFEDAAHDYWRQQVYPLAPQSLDVLLACWSGVDALKKSVRDLARRPGIAAMAQDEALGGLIAREQQALGAQLVRLKQGWAERATAMQTWIDGHRAANPKCFNGVKMKPDNLAKWFDGLRHWAQDPLLLLPAITPKAWERLTPSGIEDAFAKSFTASVPECFGHTEQLGRDLAAITPLAHTLHLHAAATIARRMDQLKRQSRQFGFADMLQRLHDALAGENGSALRQRIVEQYPLAMVDEFQDTAPAQYQIFNLLYRIADNDPAQGLFLIGDPKQSIYGFRGADIQSYLAARRATEGRHYQLGTNYRSTAPLVAAVNQLFLHAERPQVPLGAFRYRTAQANPLPFEAVEAKGRAEQLVTQDGAMPALLAACASDESLRSESYRDYFADHCAEHIVAMLGDAQAGFDGPDGFVRLQPADIAVLVRDRKEAGAIRRALARRRVASVYLSDKDSVVDSEEAADVLRWLAALANPLDGGLARAAFATRTIALSLGELARLSSDELEWERRVEQLKALHLVWQRQGVLAMLRRFIHELQLPAMLLQQTGGERRLTNLLHLAELLQSASRQLDGEQALIRWLAEQIEGGGENSDERVLRLESDAELVKVITVHKSKGLEYPLVYLPFAVTARKVDKRNRSFADYADADGERHLDLSLSDEAMAALEEARIEEDLRLLYVALTRARHFLWLGVAALAARKAGENTLHESALGYLLTGGDKLPGEQLQQRWHEVCGGCDAIAIASLAQPGAPTLLKRIEHRPELREAPQFTGRFERDWSVGSFTSLTRQIGAVASHVPQRALEETLMEDGTGAALVAPAQHLGDAPWHRFPRGSLAGNFLHEQLEWMGGEGFDCVYEANFGTRLAARCERAGWGNRQDEAIAWLREVAVTPLPLLGAPLAELDSTLSEMEFWFPSEHLATQALDELCTRLLLDGAPRPVLPRRQLHGMLKGFADLVIEREGRYWVLDYKSNALGNNDASYHTDALAAGMAQHRYDIQGAIYMLALHRLLKSRLGDAYDPAQQLGGAIFLFLRGIANPDTHGCYLLEPQRELLDGLDHILEETELHA
ncbi:exodeoxyribonuclease V subunit beta [Janthinobacterium sp.]|uniref:exodeoxyribonuclease V subunit beta n=1 Tax=Janthinobacterium sp. TaxID=1871054 RepID=UPI0028A28398|nr:exodeoxyribonuclease V subunit beta [Janthinobacterium sp.]